MLPILGRPKPDRELAWMQGSDSRGASGHRGCRPWKAARQQVQVAGALGSGDPGSEVGQHGLQVALPKGRCVVRHGGRLGQQRVTPAAARVLARPALME